MLGLTRSDRRSADVGQPEATDTRRRLHSISRIGVVAEADYTNGLIRVDLQDGELRTDWIPWLTLRAGNDRFWWAPETGEVVMLLSLSGDLANAFAVGASFSNQNQNGDRETLQRQTFHDGAVIEYDRDAHAYLIDLTAAAGSTVTIKAAGTVTVEGATIHLNP